MSLCLTALLIIFTGPVSFAQDPDCEISVDNGLGYTSIIKEVVDLGNGDYTINLSIFFDGCPGPGCKNVSYIALEADPGTYSNVSAVANVGGSTFTPSINLGPNQGGIPFTGMKISGLSNFGKVNDANVLITYTLSGGFQDQQTMVKAGSKTVIASLDAADFQSVLDCNGSNIFPYYPPPEDGKVDPLACPILGPELCSFYETYLNLGVVVTDDIFQAQVDDNNVLIVVKAEDGQLTTLQNTLTSPGYGMFDDLISIAENSVTGWYPIDNLWLITELTGIAHEAHPVFTPVTSGGLVTSQGDAAMRADISRNVFGLGGEGVKIGVLSDSYNTKPGDPANDDVVKGDLPGIGFDAGGNPVSNPLNDTDVDVLVDYPATASDEGRAMLQIVHDVAPKADLAFRTGFRSDVDFALGILELASAGCDIVLDDITYIEEPFFKDGIIAQAVETVVAGGVSYFSAAGNYGTSGYQSEFTGVAAPAGLSGQAHNFAGTAGTDVYQNVSVPEGSYTVVLQWDDGNPWGSAVADLDIYLAKDDGSTLFGFNRDNTDGRQLEVLPFTVGEGGAETNIIIVNSSSTPNVTLQYIVFRGQMTQNEWANTTAPTLVGQANAENAIAVGAVLYTNTPEYGVDPPTPASFSSRGGTPVNGILRDKPNVMGPNGVNTTVDLGGVNYEGDAFPNFFGTSAAAPHVAAVGALLMEATTKYYGTDLAPSAMRSILENAALDMDTPGYDVATGYGYTQADEALVSLANPTPLITDLVYDTTLIPGVDTIDITVIGEYLTDGSTIYFNGVPVEGITTVNGDSSITTTILPFGPLLYQPIQVENPPQPQTNGTDGGLSDPIYFTEKETVLITIDDKTKVYGEVLPEFTAASIDLVDLDGNSIPLGSSSLTAEEISRILAIAFEAPNVTALTNAGLWAITAVSTDPLNPASEVEATDPLDISLLEQYNFAIVDGLLTIEKMDITIVPQEKTITYGDEFGEIDFDYLYNNDPGSSVEITPEDDAAILSAVSQAHATVLVNARATALVNATATALVNYSFLVSATATPLVNSTDIFDLEFDDPDALFDATALVNGTATATVLVNGVSRATVLVNATALVNGTATVLVNGTATPLVNGTATVLVNANATALVNSSTINANSNSQAIVILGEEDIDVLLGNTSGEIILQPMNLVPSTDAGEHWIVPGVALLPNFNVTYEVGGPLNVLPAEATVTIDPASLSQVYDGTPKSVTATTDPAGLQIDYLYDDLADLPISAGSYEATATVNDPNYFGADTAFIVVDPAALGLIADSKEKTYGDADPLFTSTITSGELFGEDVLTGLLQRQPGEDADEYSILQGSLTAGPNYAITFEPGILTINQALLTVTADNLGKIYGFADPALTYQLTEGALVGDDEFSGSLTRDPGENVGPYAILQGDLSAGDNYILTFNEGIFTIDQAFLTVTANDASKTYGETDPLLTYLISSGDLVEGDAFTGDLLREPGEGATTYGILQGSLSAGGNYALSFVPAIFTINPAAITVSADNVSKTYGGTDPGLTYQLTTGTLVGGDSFNGTLVRTAGETAGDYNITQGDLSAGTNYSLTFIEGIFSINPAGLIITVQPEIQFIFEGDDLPTFPLTFSGFVNGEDETVLTGVTTSFSPNYNGNAGTYQVIPQASSSNYSISVVIGILYVNPFGPGTKHINPKLICVETLPPGSAYGYVANYSYQNKNNDDVYIPYGEDNSIGAVGSFDGSAQPELFLAGGGTFSIPFDGLDMTWTVASYNHKGQKAAQGAGATATSPDCNKDAVVENADDLKTGDAITAYPNPTSNRIYLNVGEFTVTSDDVSVYDIQGNLCPIGEIRPSGSLMEVDLTGMEKGVYFVRINIENSVEMIRVIKQ